MNGDILGSGTPNARDLTREIERETNLAVEAEDERERGESRHQQAVNLGNKVLTYNPERVADAERQRGQEAERVREMVETENGPGREAGEQLEPGAESELLIKEREAWNYENMLNELDPKRDREAQIMARDQMGIGREMSDLVEKFTRTDDFRIMDLVIMQSKGRDHMLESFENPRRLGDMN